MSCGCARCALQRKKGGLGCQEHAETPRTTSGAAGPTTSKFAAWRRKLALKMDLPGTKLPGLPTTSRMSLGSTAATRATVPATGDGPTSPKLAGRR